MTTRSNKGNAESIKNQIETTNLAKRKKETTMDSKKTIKFRDWEQTSTDVVIHLFAGKKLSSNELNVDFTDSGVSVNLTDGRHWSCQFCYEIRRTGSKVQLQKMAITLRMKKKETGVSWPSLEFQDLSQAESISEPVVASPSKKSQSQRRMTPTSSCGDFTSARNASPIRSKVQPNEINASLRSENGKNRTRQAKGSDENLEIEIPGERHPAAGDVSSTDESGDKNLKVEGMESEKDEEEVYELNHIKNDWYERNLDSIVVYIYVKSIRKDTVDIHFGEKSICVKFQTGDQKFLKMHEKSSEDTVFRWRVEVVDLLRVEECHYKVKGQTIELTLYKVNHAKWGALEASQTKAALTPASGSWLSPIKKTGDGTEVKGEEDVPLMLEDASIEASKEAEGFSSSKSSWQASNKMNILGENSKENVQKPTCMVSPLSKEDYKRGHVTTPGYTGLDNLGNTCFMNASLQVLANTRELRDYFLDGRYQAEINPDNVLGTGGKLAVMFALLMRTLWEGKHRSYAPAKLKNMVAMKWNQFMGYAQHDAQEFMAFLLDGLHEDLNRVKDKPYTEQVDSDGRADEVVANEAWAVHKRRNDSLIVDLFQGQYKSKLVCPACSKVSITFDPFMILPVPLPKKQRLLPVTFFSKEPRKKPMKFMLQLSKDATVEQLKDQIYQKTRVHPRDLRVFEAHKHRVHSFYDKGSKLTNVQETHDVFVFETLSEKLAGEPVVELCVLQRTHIPITVPSRCSCCHRDCSPEMKLKRCSKCYKTAYCDKKCQSQDWPRHQPMCKQVPELIGQPFMVSLPESKATYSQLCQMLEVKASYSVDVFQPPVNTTPTRAETPACPSSPTDSLDASTPDLYIAPPKSKSASSTISSPPPEDDEGITINPPSPGLTPSQSESSLPESGIDVASVSCLKPSTGEESSEAAGPATGYVFGKQIDAPENQLFQFDLRPCDKDGKNLPGSKGFKLQDKGEEPLDLSGVHSLAMVWKNHEKSVPYVVVHSKEVMDHVNHESVLTMSSEEKGDITLDQCLSLFTEPEVLSPEYTWYCPKCKEHREATKQLSIWRLPHTLIIQLKRFSFRNFLWRDKIDKKVDFPVRGLDLTKYFIGNRPRNEPPPIYDLYGVVNHHGGILGGHYTSFARCPDSQNWKRNLIDWRLFDDSMVSSSAESQVVTRSAYVLFYRRRDLSVSLPDTVPTLEEKPDQEVGQEDDDEDILLKEEDGMDDDSNMMDPKSDHLSQDDELDLGGLGPPEILDNRFAEGDSDSEEDKHRLNLGMDLHSPLDDFMQSDAPSMRQFDEEDSAACFERDFDDKYPVPAPSPSCTDMDAVD